MTIDRIIDLIKFFGADEQTRREPLASFAGYQRSCKADTSECEECGFECEAIRLEATG